MDSLTREWTVQEHWTVPRILPGTALAQRGEPVLATGILVALLESATWEALDVAPEVAILGRAGQYEHTSPARAGEVLRVDVACLNRTRQFWRAVATHLSTGRQVGRLDHEVVLVEHTRWVVSYDSHRP